MKSLVKNSVFNMIYAVLNMLFPLVVSMYVSRVLLVEGVGKVAYAQNIASYFVTFASLGLPMYGTREIAKVVRDKKKQNKLFTEIFVINTVSTTMFLLVYIIMLFIIQTEEKMLFMACGIQLFFNYINIEWFYRGHEEYIYIVCRSLIIKIVSIMAIFLFVKDKNDYIIYAAINNLAICGNYVFNIIHAKKYIEFDFRGINLKRHMSPLIVFALITLLSSIYNKVDLTMIGILADNTAVGIYSNSHKIIDVILAAITSISAVLLPRLSFLYKNDAKKFFELINNGIEVIVFLVLPAMAGILLLAPDIISILYGEAFIDSAKTVRLFVPMLLIRSLGDLVCYQVSISIEQEKKRLPTFVIAAILNVVLNYIFIPIYLQNAAVMTSIISELVADIIFIISIRRILQIKIRFRGIMDAVLTTVLMSAVVYALTVNLNSPVIKCLVGICMGILVYLLFNFIVRNKTLFIILNRLSAINFLRNANRKSVKK